MVLALVLLITCYSAHAADSPIRMALIINQVDYRTLTPLPDTDGEARLIADALTKDGFDVTRVRNATLTGSGGTPSLEATFRDFRRKLAASPGAIGFIYYTGHGIADPTDDKGDNYLLGIDADLKVVADLPASGMKLGDLTTQMSRTDASAVIIVIDACRNTPSLGKAATKGLVAVAPEPNTLIAYSTDIGDIAGVGVYAPVLAHELTEPGHTITQVFDAVQVQVSQQTGRKQRPWTNNRIYDTLCLAGCTINVNLPAPDLDWQKEQAVWASVHDCGDYRAYLAQYP
ncbi:MAG: caspase family protein, partial [Asticcacaulis sp.]|nr:caspase family protein [Asticcacaulis sp.]